MADQDPYCRIGLNGPYRFALICIWVLALSLARPTGALSAITLEDMAGRAVTISKPVHRLVTTFKPATLCVLSLGLGDKLVGVDTSSKQDRLHLAVHPPIADTIAVGNKRMGLSYETVIALAPDLVILFAQKDGIALSQRLEQVGIPSLIILPEDFSTIKSALNLIARAVGEPQRTRPAFNAMDDILSFVDQRIGAIGPDERRTGYFASSIGLFSTTTRNMLQDKMFERAGIRNVSHDLEGYFQDISPEQFMAWNPDLVVLSQHLNKNTIKRLSSPALKRVSAIRDKQVFRCPSDLSPWDFPSPLSVLGVLWMAQKAYPEKFSDVDILRMADRFHKTLFGKSMSGMGGTLHDNLD